MHSEHATGKAMALLFGWLLAWPGMAQPVQENELKAAFIFNFAVFTEWPQQALAPGAPISVCANASHAMLPALLQLSDKLINGHRIAVRAAASPVRTCHVLVLGRDDRQHWQRLRRELGGAAVLTVADEVDVDGAVIALSMEQQHIGFDVDIGAARGAQLTLSSKLLRLARSVQ